MPAARSDTGVASTQFVDGRLVLLNGSTVCPSRALCDRLTGESQQSYVRRHCRDHGLELAMLGDFEDARRNLFLYCFYYCHKYEIGNPTLSPDPFWEHHVFMAEWTFNSDDLEQGWDKDLRKYRIPDYADMRPDRVTKNFKKVEKPRGTEKSAVGRAYVTWRLIRAYHVDNNPYFRVLVISATSRLARNQWFKPLKTLWNANKNLRTLFGAWEFTCDRCGRRQISATQLKVRQGRMESGDPCPMCEEELGARVRMRQVSIVTKGSFGTDNIQMRWTVIAGDDFSGMAAENFQFLGCDSEVTGQRFDLAVCDDLSTKKNSRTEELREMVKMVLAEIMKTLDQEAGQIILQDTRKHLDDLAGDIDRQDGPYYDQFHIMHRRATWIDRHTGETMYYWAYDALGGRRLNEDKLRREMQNSAERDFFSEYQNEPQDPSKSAFKPEWFKPVDDRDVPPAVLWGLGEDLTDEQKRQLEQMGVVIHTIIYVDPAGQEKQKARNDDTAIVCVRIYAGRVWIVRIVSFKGPDSYEKEQIYQAASYCKPRRIRYEMPAHTKGIEQGFINFANEKSKELTEALKRPISVYLPMDFQTVATIIAKTDKIHRTEPIWRNGQAKLLARAGQPNELGKFRDQFVNLGIQNRDDYPDAWSSVLEDFAIPSFQTQAEEKAAAAEATVNERGNIEIPVADVFRDMMSRAKGRSRNWGVEGGSGFRRQ